MKIPEHCGEKKWKPKKKSKENFSVSQYLLKVKHEKLK